METLVSVIIPVYNAEQYISDAVQSVFAQTLKEWELLIVDDGSTDRTSDICAVYQKMNAGGVKVITHEKNLGVGAARNTGIRAAYGKYIVFLDADDILTEDSLEVRVRKMEENQLAMGVFSYFIEIDEKPPLERKLLGVGRYEGVRFLERIALAQTGANHTFVGVWDKIFRRDIIQNKEIRFPEDRQMYEDGAFVLEYILACGGWIEVEDIRVVHYHIRSCNKGSLGTRFRREKFRYMYDAIKEWYLTQFKVLNKRGIFTDSVRAGFYHDYINKMIDAIYSVGKSGGGLEDVGILFEDTFFMTGIETYQCRNAGEDPKIIEILREKNVDSLLGYLRE